MYNIHVTLGLECKLRVGTSAAAMYGKNCSLRKVNWTLRDVISVAEYLPYFTAVVV